jgi:hypothetical protein
MRFARDKKLLEDRIAKMQTDLSTERQGVNKVELSERYQCDLTRYQGMLKRALEICSRKSVTLFAPNFEDIQAVEAFLQKLEALEVARPTPSEDILAMNGSSLSNEQLEAFGSSLRRLPVDKQQRLLHRFEMAVLANFSNSARFGVTSGLPDRSEDPSVLLNHIANVTTQNEILLSKIADLQANGPGGLHSLDLGKYGKASTRFLRNPRTQGSTALLVQDSALFTIGRVPGANLTIDSDHVSRVHAAIKCCPAPEDPVVVDLGSIRGTFVNGRRITAPTPLRNKDTVAFGDTSTSFTYHEDAPSQLLSVRGVSPDVTAKVRSRSEPNFAPSNSMPIRRTPPATPREPAADDSANGHSSTVPVIRKSPSVNTGFTSAPVSQRKKVRPDLKTKTSSKAWH